MWFHLCVKLFKLYVVHIRMYQWRMASFFHVSSFPLFHPSPLYLGFLKITYFLQKYKLIDTAGIRRRAAVASAGNATEALSVNRAFGAIRRSDVVALVIEAMLCITEQVSFVNLEVCIT